MQEGAGVRQIVEDELRALGIRLRDLDVRLELGLQESVRSAVQAGYGVTFISRSAVESELAAGTLAAARVEGLEATREISLARTSGRTSTRAADAFVEFARERLAVIVRWGLDELPPAASASGRSSSRASAGARSSSAVDRWTEVPSAPNRRVAGRLRRHRRRRRRERDRHGQGGLGRERPTARLGARRPTRARSGREFYGVRDPDRRMQGGGAGAHLHAIVYEPKLTLELPAPRPSARR